MPPAKRFKPYTASPFKAPIQKSESFEELKPYQECIDEDMEPESDHDLGDSDEEQDIEEAVEDLQEELSELREELDALKEKLENYITWSKQNMPTSTTLQPPQSPTQLQAQPVSSLGLPESSIQLPQISSLKAPMMDLSLEPKSISLSGSGQPPLLATPDSRSTFLMMKSPRTRSHTRTNTLFKPIEIFSESSLSSGNAGKEETLLTPFSN